MGRLLGVCQHNYSVFALFCLVNEIKGGWENAEQVKETQHNKRGALEMGTLRPWRTGKGGPKVRGMTKKNRWRHSLHLPWFANILRTQDLFFLCIDSSLIGLDIDLFLCFHNPN